MSFCNGTPSEEPVGFDENNGERRNIFFDSVNLKVSPIAKSLRQMTMFVDTRRAVRFVGEVDFNYLGHAQRELNWEAASAVAITMLQHMCRYVCMLGLPRMPLEPIRPIRVAIVPVCGQLWNKFLVLRPFPNKLGNIVDDRISREKKMI